MGAMEAAAPRNDIITILLIFAFVCLAVSIGIVYYELSTVYEAF